MPKFIPTLERAQARKIEALEKKLEGSQSENQRLREKNQRLSKLALSGKSPKAITSRQSVSVIVSEIPSYLRPTTASKSREKEAVATEPKLLEQVEDDRSEMYEDGKLVRVGTRHSIARYRWSTVASDAKASKSHAVGGWAYTPTIPGTPALRFSSPTPAVVDQDEDDEPEYEHINNNVGCERCNWLESCWKDESTKSLARRTRLCDTWFQNSHLAEICIPFRKLYALLRSAMGVAQDTIYHALRTHWPSTRLESCPGGPRQVKLGRAERIRFTYHDTDFLFREDFARDVLDHSLSELADLRNAVCHQSQPTLCTADIYLSQVQKVAVILMDEKMAARARALRDELQRAAEKAFAQIACRYFARWGPFPTRRTWAMHHQQAFWRVLGFYRTGDPRYNTTPDVVKLATWDWAYEVGNISPGEKDPNFVASLKKAKSLVKQMEPAPPSSGCNLDGTSSKEFEKAMTALENSSSESRPTPLEPRTDEQVHWLRLKERV